MANISRTRRQTRWRPESMAFKLTNLRPYVTGGMTNEQKEAYALHVRIEEITQQLKIDDVVPANPHRRSPSPDPEYNEAGQRINTRYIRHRRKLERECHMLVQQAIRIIPGYHPPRGYKSLGAFSRAAIEEKVYIPAKDFPELNFIGQLLGPRGQTLKEMNKKTGANIVIRGKGSVKEGSARTTANGRRRADDQHEPLHCLITADCHEKATEAKKLVSELIQDVITVPDHTNERKREQLRALAVVNGTFRDDEARGSSFIAPGNPRQGIICHGCGNGGHILRDCPDKRGRRPGAASSEQEVLPPWRRNRVLARDTDSVELACEQFLDNIKGGGF